MRPLAFDFDEEVYDIVRQIPAGRVVSYGQIARLIGQPNQARRVGVAMKNAPAERQLPCHRAVNSQGRTVPGWSEQRLLLEAEGVRFTSDSRVDMKSFVWREVL